MAKPNPMKLEDGTLVANGFSIYLCSEDCAHIDLLDEAGTKFATLTIPPEMFRDIASDLMEFHNAVVDKRVGTQ